MKSLEYLMQLHPNKTAKEILEIQAKEKLEDKKKEDKRNEKQLAFIEDLNKNGGFYKGRFGSDQHYYYNITNARLEENKIYATVEHLIAFLGHKTGVVQPGEITMEVRKKTYQDLHNYGLDTDMCKRTTKKDYDSVYKYMSDISKFWDDIKMK